MYINRHILFFLNTCGLNIVCWTESPSINPIVANYLAQGKSVHRKVEAGCNSQTQLSETSLDISSWLSAHLWTCFW